MRTRKPFKELPLEEVGEVFPELGESLTHYEVDEDDGVLVVSILHSVWGWEVWAWTKDRHDKFASLFPKPVVYDSEEEALARRDQVIEERKT